MTHYTYTDKRAQYACPRRFIYCNDYVQTAPTDDKYFTFTSDAITQIIARQYELVTVTYIISLCYRHNGISILRDHTKNNDATETGICNDQRFLCRWTKTSGVLADNQLCTTPLRVKLTICCISYHFWWLGLVQIHIADYIDSKICYIEVCVFHESL